MNSVNYVVLDDATFTYIQIHVKHQRTSARIYTHMYVYVIYI